MSESCNLACRYCYCGDRLHTRNISRANIRESIHWMLENSGDNQELELVFFGGEPLMNRSGIEYAIDYSTEIGKCYSKSFKYRMTSNVTLIDDKIADFLVKNKVQVLVSLDGPQEIHDMQCPTVAGGGSFEMASAGAKRLLQRQKNVAVRSTVTSPVTNIEMLLKFYEEFGFSSVFLGPAGNPEISQKQYDFTEEDFFDFYRQHEALLPDILYKLENKEKVFYNPYLRYVERFDPFKGSKRMNLTNCGAAGRGCLYVNVDGEIYPCHHFYGMESWSLGNVNDEKKLLDVNQLKRFWSRYHKIREKCESCWAALICMGPCAADQMTKTGFFNPNIRFCDARRFNIERAGYFFYKNNILNDNCK